MSDSFRTARWPLPQRLRKSSKPHSGSLRSISAIWPTLQNTNVGQWKSRHVSNKSSYTVSFPRQVMACFKREAWLLWGDKTSLYTKVFIIISNGLIVGSLFYGESLDTSGAFSRGGALFISILFLGWLQLSELMKAVSGRVVVARHKYVPSNRTEKPTDRSVQRVRLLSTIRSRDCSSPA
jgi:hypothetical protein